MPILVGDFEESECFDNEGELPTPTNEDWCDLCLFSEPLACDALLCNESVFNFDN